MALTQLAAYNTITLTAGEDLTAKQFRFVKVEASTGQVVLAGAGDPAVGVLLNKPNDLEAAEIQIGGVSKVQADAAVTAGDRVMSSADGQVATKTGTNNALGIALESATTVGDVIAIKLEQSDGVVGGGIGSFTTGAITPGVSLALLTIVGTIPFTLADGTFAGQELTLLVVAASATPIATLTIATPYTGESATHLLTGVDQLLKFKWTAVGWRLVDAEGAETKTVAAALNPYLPTSYLNFTGTVAFTMAAGSILGQRKRIECSGVAGTPLGTVTVADMAGSEPTALTFTTVGQAVDLEWQSGGWHILNINQIGFEVVAPDASANPLCLMHHVVIADTVDFIQPVGLFGGQKSYWLATSNSGTPVGTVSGLFYTLAGAATGVDVQFNAGSDAAYLEWLGARWHPVYLVSAAIA